MKTYGTLELTEGNWVVNSTPDVIMRLKRIFPRSNQHRLGQIQIKATHETAFEIKWVLERFPLVVDTSVQKQLNKSAKAHSAKMDRLEGLQLDVRLPTTLSMAISPRDYQVFAAAMHLERNFLLLADMIGLGKTISAITTFTDIRTLPALVVVQAHLPTQWKREIGKLLPSARVHIIASRANYPLPEAEVYIISYSKLDAWYEVLAKIIKSLVFDEVQELRRPESEKYKAAKLLGTAVQYRLGLSATPVVNYGGEIWNIFNILAPDVLGTEEEFLREWCPHSNGGKHVVQNPEALGQYLRANFLMLRRTRKEVGRELPPVTRYVIDAEVDMGKFNAGVSAAEDLANMILTGSFHERGVAAREFDLKLRQATGVAKAAFVAGLVRMLVDSGEKVYLCAWHRAVHDIFAKLLSDLKPVFYTGEESPTQKQESIDQFTKGDSNVFIISNKSGAGINDLQFVCSTVVIGELEWSDKHIDQLIGRIDRDGQVNPVNVYIPVCDVGSDPTMAQILGVKRGQSAGIVEIGETATGGITSIDPDRIKKLAIEFLRSRKRPIPTDVLVSAADAAPNSPQSEFALSA